MMQAYQSHPKKLEVDNEGTIQTLKGLRIDVEHVRQIINRTDIEITHLMVIFGVKEEDLNKPTSDQYFTTAFAGISEDSQNPDGALVTNYIYDFCMPCPPKCPTGL